MLKRWHPQPAIPPPISLQTGRLIWFWPGQKIFHCSLESVSHDYKRFDSPRNEAQTRADLRTHPEYKFPLLLLHLHPRSFFLWMPKGFGVFKQLVSASYTQNLKWNYIMHPSKKSHYTREMGNSGTWLVRRCWLTFHNATARTVASRDRWTLVLTTQLVVFSSFLSFFQSWIALKVWIWMWMLIKFHFELECVNNDSSYYFTNCLFKNKIMQC